MWNCSCHDLGLVKLKFVQQLYTVHVSQELDHVVWFHNGPLDSLWSLCWKRKHKSDKYEISTENVFGWGLNMNKNTYLTDVQTKSFKPCNSTSLKFNSMLTGLSPPCLICIRLIFNGSICANAIFGSPIQWKICMKKKIRTEGLRFGFVLFCLIDCFRSLPLWKFFKIIVVVCLIHSVSPTWHCCIAWAVWCVWKITKIHFNSN